MDAQYILDFGRPLCELVQQCLMHFPSDRPSLLELKRRTREGKRLNPMDPGPLDWMKDRLYGVGVHVPPGMSSVPIPPHQGVGVGASIPSAILF